MKRLIVAALAAACVAAPASAGDAPRKKIDIVEPPAYDRKLELAAMRMVAGRIGDIRGGLEADFGPVLVAVGRDRDQAIGGIFSATAIEPTRLAGSID